MGMSTSLYGIKPADTKFKQMKAVWDACMAAGLQVPDEVRTFFKDEEPNERGVQIDLRRTPGVSDHGELGFTVDLQKIDKDIRYLVFENSW
jgi:hypothetical protein